MATGVMVSLTISSLWIALQMAWMHVRPARNRFRAMLAGFAASLPVLVLVLGSSPVRAFHAAHFVEPYGLVFFHALLCHTLVFFCYVECFYHVERAVTFRMLIEIAAHRDGILFSDLRKDYSVPGMVGARMEVLEARGFVVRRMHAWHLTSKGRLLARVMAGTLWLYQAKSQRDRKA